MFKIKRKLCLFLVVFLLAFIVGGIVIGVILNSPKMVLSRSVPKFVDDLLAREEIKPVYKMLKKGSLEISLDNIKVDGDYYDYDSDFNAKGKIYFAGDKVMLSGVEVNNWGGINDFAGDVYLSSDTIYITENKILKGTYGVKVEDFKEDLADSIFAYGSDSDYEMDRYSYNKITDMVDFLDRSEDMSKDTKKLTKDVFKDVMNIVFDRAEVESENDKVRFDGKDKRVRVITVEIDDKAIAHIITDIYEYLCDSDDIVEFFEEYESVLVALTGLDADAYEELLEENEDYVEEFCEEIEGFEDITIEIVTPILSAKLLKVEVEVGKRTVFSFDCGSKGIKRSDKVELEFDGQEIVYEVKEDSRKKFEANFSSKNEWIEDSISIEVDRKNGKYVIKDNRFYEDYYSSSTGTVKGKISEKKGKTTLTVDKIIESYEWEDSFGYGDSGEYIYELDCTIVIDSKDRMPSPKKNFKKIDEITEEDIEKFFD